MPLMYLAQAKNYTLNILAKQCIVGGSGTGKGRVLQPLDLKESAGELDKPKWLKASLFYMIVLMLLKDHPISVEPL